ncbi:TIGR02206 family membrane protein [Brevibacillus nitrificans]|uniref:TIGR02206 family membrane protein n=1 Tax=Brevibacillus nitrificans TaxID=651560 RepID=A0A3M8DIQ8_9BACL|nr:TIGR02206 family membrane protein [Brevibacillus nitrificans]RNB88002.1 TIGR02206 family membrane protein [Brevibacillus nitrificans]
MTSSFLSAEITTEPFQLFSASHVSCVLLVFAAAALLYQLRRRIQPPRIDAFCRLALASLLVLTEIGFQLWLVWTHTWTRSEALPLQLCSVMLIFSVFMLVSNSYRLYEITFFAGLIGAGQALITPELFYPFPHFRFFHFFLAHACIVLACLYMTWVKNYRPTVWSIGKSMVMLNSLLLIALIVNRFTGGNYLFVAHKPFQPTLMDYLGPYPWYILSLEGVALGLFFLLYLPFWIQKRRAARQSLGA